MGKSDGTPSGPEAAGSASGRHFVNQLRVTLALSEIRFDLALLGSGPLNAPTWRFATTPDHLKTMQQGLALAIDNYTARYGEIRGVQVDPAVVRFADGHAHG